MVVTTFWPLIFLLGAAVGSFLNVVVLRSKQERDWIKTRSACPHCGATLAWWEMLPVVSFTIQRGRCRHCRKRLSLQYLIAEIVTGLGFLGVWFTFGFTPTELLVGWVVVAAMVLIGLYDGRWQLIPDPYTYLLAISGLAAAWLASIAWPDIIIGGLVGAAFFAIQFQLSQGRWVGSGDILLGAALGMLLGWKLLAVALMLAYFLGAVVAVWKLATRRATRTSAMAFGPYLVLGGYIAWLWGPTIIDWYFRYAVAY